MTEPPASPKRGLLDRLGLPTHFEREKVLVTAVLLAAVGAFVHCEREQDAYERGRKEMVGWFEAYNACFDEKRPASRSIWETLDIHYECQEKASADTGTDAPYDPSPLNDLE